MRRSPICSRRPRAAPGCRTARPREIALMAGDIAIAVEGGLATLRLRNPERRNAISAAMWQQVRDFAEAAPGRADVRVVLIRGDGDLAFSAGADIAGFDEARSGTDNARGYDDLVEYT